MRHSQAGWKKQKAPKAPLSPLAVFGCQEQTDSPPLFFSRSAREPPLFTRGRRAAGRTGVKSLSLSLETMTKKTPCFHGRQCLPTRLKVEGGKRDIRVEIGLLMCIRRTDNTKGGCWWGGKKSNYLVGGTRRKSHMFASRERLSL